MTKPIGAKVVGSQPGGGDDSTPGLPAALTGRSVEAVEEDPADVTVSSPLGRSAAAEASAAAASAGELAEAAQGSAGTAGSGEDTIEKQLAVDLLMNGCVESFCDFLKNTEEEKHMPAIAEAAAAEGEEPEEEDPQEAAEKAMFAENNADAAADPMDALMEKKVLTLDDIRVAAAKAAEARPAIEVGHLAQILQEAETLLAEKDFGGAVSSYNALAVYFETGHPSFKSDYRFVASARFFYRKCVDLALDAGAGSLTLCQANLNLGGCESRLGAHKMAMGYTEMALELASGDESEAAESWQASSAARLCEVYKTLAEGLLESLADNGKKSGGAGTSNPSRLMIGMPGFGAGDAAGNAERAGESDENDEVRLKALAAAQLYQKCILCGEVAGDVTLQGVSCYRLGKTKALLGEHDEAISLQKQYLQICLGGENALEGDRDKVGEVAARAALAHSSEALGNISEAMHHLETLLNVAVDAGELEAQAQACLNLGLLYFESSANRKTAADADAYEKSIKLLERHFDLARHLGDRKLVDAARVILGMARGNGKLDVYMHCVRHDLGRLLDWKSRRVSLKL